MNLKVFVNLKGEEGHECHNVYDPNGIAPTVRHNHGKITMVYIPVKKRKIQIAYRVDGFNPNFKYKEVQVAGALQSTNQTNPKSAGTTLIMERKMELKKTIYGKHQQDCFYDPTGIAPAVCPGTHASGPHLLKIILTKEGKE